jgi:tetratricopeptide (TPR) repeat protein
MSIFISGQSLSRSILLIVSLTAGVTVSGCGRTAEELETRGDELMIAGEVQKALAVYSAALRSSPESPDLNLKMARAFQQRGNLDEAMTRYSVALDADPTRHAARLALTVLQMEKGLWRGASSNLGRLRSAIPEEAQVYRLLARLAERERDENQELSHWITAAVLDPSDPLPRHEIGRIYFDRGKYERAVAEFRRSVRSDPGYEEIYLDLGLALIELNRIDEAETAYRRYIDTHQRDAQAYYRLGNALFSKGYSNRAKPHYRRALTLDPGFVEAHFNLGMACYDDGQFSEARRAFEQAVMWSEEGLLKDSARRMLRQIPTDNPLP